MARWLISTEPGRHPCFKSSADSISFGGFRESNQDLQGSTRNSSTTACHPPSPFAALAARGLECARSHLAERNDSAERSYASGPVRAQISGNGWVGLCVPGTGLWLEGVSKPSTSIFNFCRYLSASPETWTSCRPSRLTAYPSPTVSASSRITRAALPRLQACPMSMSAFATVSPMSVSK